MGPQEWQGGYTSTIKEVNSKEMSDLNNKTYEGAKFLGKKTGEQLWKSIFSIK